MNAATDASRKREQGRSSSLAARDCVLREGNKAAPIVQKETVLAGDNLALIRKRVNSSDKHRIFLRFQHWCGDRTSKLSVMFLYALRSRHLEVASKKTKTVSQVTYR